MFVTFEGIDGSGKTAQLTAAGEFLKASGKQVVLTREPGTISCIRDYVLASDMDIRTEALLYSADRAENIAKNVIPALNAGKVVLQDRYLDSFLAYQLADNKLVETDIMRLFEFSSQGLRPDLTLLFDLTPACAQERLENRDRIERKPIDFHSKVRSIYLKLSADNTDRIRVIDASQSFSKIHQQVIYHIERKLGGTHSV